MSRLRAKRLRAHPKGGLDPLGSSEHQGIDRSPSSPKGIGSELPKAASIYKTRSLLPGFTRAQRSYQNSKALLKWQQIPVHTIFR